jgi:glycerophosphoryl diester phosphodiesterase
MNDFIGRHPMYSRKTLIAHRGASAYAPEHTLDSYRLAIAQKADYVEQDLQITKDGILVCLHDLSLERTTNVAEVFPNRCVREDSGPRWYAADFTLAEIKALDAGSWFGSTFRGAQIPTWQEAVNMMRGRAGLFPETKAPEVYGKRGFNMERLLAESLRKNGLDATDSSISTIVIQSFSPDSLRRLRVDYDVRVPLVQLLGSATTPTAEMIRRIREYAHGIGPSKDLVRNNPDLVGWAHDADLSVTAYTFRQSDEMQFATVRAEMDYFLNTLGVDALFTDNPDMFPRENPQVCR